MNRDRYYVKTRYHVWTIMRRHDANLDPAAKPNSNLDEPVEHIGARGRGDAAARTLARETTDRLNGVFA